MQTQNSYSNHLPVNTSTHVSPFCTTTFGSATCLFSLSVRFICLRQCHVFRQFIFVDLRRANMQRDFVILTKPPSSFTAYRSRAATAPGGTRRSSLGFTDADLLLHRLAHAAKSTRVLDPPMTLSSSVRSLARGVFLRFVYEIWTLGGCTAWRLR